MFCFRPLQSCAGQEKWHPLTLQKVFRQVKLSFEDLISILLLFLQAAVPCSAGKPLAMRFVWGLINISCLNSDSVQVCGSKAAKSYKEAALGY